MALQAVPGAIAGYQEGLPPLTCGDCARSGEVVATTTPPPIGARPALVTVGGWTLILVRCALAIEPPNWFAGDGEARELVGNERFEGGVREIIWE